MSTQNLTIRIDQSHAQKFDSIVQELEARGLKGVAPTKRFLIVNGTAEEHAIADLGNVDGIASVREEQSFSAI